MYRLKQHITGIASNITSCSVAKEEDKKRFKGPIEEGKGKKNKQKEVRDEVQIALNEEEDDSIARLVKRGNKNLVQDSPEISIE